MDQADRLADQIPQPSHDVDRATAKFTLVGGGIASMAAAVFMIRDGDILGRNITILEELDIPARQSRRRGFGRERLCPARWADV
jgi:myosin-crossreactive antigen